MSTAPETVTTHRLVLRRPVVADASAILGYAGDPAVTRYLSWNRHRSLADSVAFVEWADRAWAAGVGPYLVTFPDGAVLGSTGLDPTAPTRASTGYVLARHAWGRGYATEVAAAMVGLAEAIGITVLDALCHVEHVASARVLEKVGFVRLEGVRDDVVLPNLDPRRPAPVQHWVRRSGASGPQYPARPARCDGGLADRGTVARFVEPAHAVGQDADRGGSRAARVPTPAPAPPGRPPPPRPAPPEPEA